MTGGPETRTVIYEPIGSAPRRVQFVPLESGDYRRVESEWTGCIWRRCGEEIVELHEFDAPETNGLTIE